VLYRYGRIAWLWRALIFAALAGAGFLIAAGARAGAPSLYLVALPLLLPSLLFGQVVATTVVRREDGGLIVTNLLFLRRRLLRSELGRPRVRPWAQADYGQIYAPSSWIPVRGSLPVYLDLLADIPDRRALAKTFQLNERDLPRPRARATD
jgi:hypothetical protein